MAGEFPLDFESLREGTGFRTNGRTITEADLVSFSALTGDFHPIHVDAEWAAANGTFGGRVAHGMMLLSYCVGMAPLDPAYVVALRGFEQVEFKRPVGIGDTIRLEGEVAAKKEIDGATGLVEFEWKILNQRDELVSRARPQLVWRRAAP